MKILIASSWPYANGSLHIGHLASSLPGDVLARYYRLKGEDVYYVSGTDCHGTPVSIRAAKEGKSPREISDTYHEEFSDCFEKLGFSYDNYTKTSAPEHVDFVTEFHRVLYQSPLIYEKEAPEAYCECCQRILSDRYVTGLCPICGEAARGDQCDACGAVLEPVQLLDPVCDSCNLTPVFHQEKHLYIAISRLEKELRTLVDSHQEWRKNAIAFSNRYLNEGLRDRAITRNLDWGIDVPRADYDDKKIYIWAENVLGYLSASKTVCDARETEFNDLWGENSRHYYIHGKDNIPFHTIILPSLLIAHGGGWHLPDDVISSEYMTLDGKRISTSKNYAVWAKDLIGRFHPDSIRYFLLSNGPEKRDTDFSWHEYIKSHNGELLGAYGNLINRTLVFIWKYFDGVVPVGVIDPAIERKLSGLYAAAGAAIEKGNCKDALELIFDTVRWSNKYFDSSAPWLTRTQNPEECAATLYQCVQLVGNLAILLEPFLPFSSERVFGWLQLKRNWQLQIVGSNIVIPEPELLFVRLDKDNIE